MRSAPLLGFSTLGNPTASLRGGCELARRFGLEFIELRALHGTTDLPSVFDSQEFESCQDISVRLMASSLRLRDYGQQDLEAFCKLAALADRMGAPYIRIFGAGGIAFGPEPGADLLRSLAQGVRHIRQILEAGRHRCELLLETHDIFSSSARCLALNEYLDEPLNVLWDSHHTWRLSGESPEETWIALGPYIRHIHYKDSVASPTSAEGWQYVLPGDGEFPSERLARLLRDENYTGGVSLEWEKMWHPDLPPIEKALGLFRQRFTNLEAPPSARLS